MSNTRILIIDDDQATLTALPALLQSRLGDIQVDTSNHPQEALKKVAAVDYDAIITDIKMPGMDGLSLLTRVRQIRPDIPVLLMTSYSDREMVVYALRGGAYDFIQKPIEIEYFVASIQRAVQTCQLRKQVNRQKQALENHAEELERTVQAAVAEAQEAHKRLAFLASASTLLAASLDYEATLARVARLAVLYLADFCLVDIVQEGGHLHCVAYAHRDRRQEELVGRLREYYQQHGNEKYPPAAVIQRGEALLNSDVTQSWLKSTALNAEHLQLLNRLHPRSTIMVPLIANDQPIGVLTFALTGAGPGRRYQADDLTLAEDLTRRAALAVDNARLYQDAQNVIERQKQLDRLKDHFLSIASHELRTPLTSVKGYAQILERRLAHSAGPPDEATRAKNDRLIAGIIYQVDRMNGLIAEMLDITRIQSQNFELKYCDECDLNELVRRVVEQQQDISTEHPLEFISAGVPVLGSWDDARLEQVLNNLISNAIKYSQPGKPVRVGLEMARPPTPAARPEVVIWVQDEGMGIGPEHRQHIFDRFYRVRTDENFSVDGLGLGLFISHEIVMRHGGRMWLESEEGRGSTFYFALPLHPAPATSGPEVAGAPYASDGRLALSS